MSTTIQIREEVASLVVKEGDDVISVGGEQPTLFLGGSTLLPSSPNDRAKVSAADTTTDYLSAKIVAGTGITVAILNPGANETFEITSTAATETLQGTYDASNPARIVVDGTNLGVEIRDNGTPIGASLFSVQSNDGLTDYFGANASGIHTEGQLVVGGNSTALTHDIAIGGGGRIGGNTFSGSFVDFANPMEYHAASGTHTFYRGSGVGSIGFTVVHDGSNPQAWFQAGSAAFPSAAFRTDTDSGFYSLGADAFAAATGGSVHTTFAASGQIIVGAEATSRTFDIVLPNNGSIGGQTFGGSSLTIGGIPVLTGNSGLDLSAASGVIRLGISGTSTIQFGTVATPQWSIDALGDFVDLVGGNLVDGRDVSVDGSTLDTHVADATIHFTEASIDHTAILNIGTNTHAAIDSHIASSANPHTVTLQQAFDAGNVIASTTAGLGIPTMTTAQRTALADVEGLIVYDSDVDQVHQNDGTGWTIPGAGLTNLQGAYDNDPAGAQILLNATPDPITIQASVAGNVFDVLDVGGNTILSVNADPDTVVASAGVTIQDAFTNSAAPISLVFDDTFTTGGGFIGGALSTTGIITYDNALFIQATFAEQKTYRGAVAPGFAAYTVMNILPAIENAGNFDLLSAVGVNHGTQHRRVTSGTSAVVNNIGLSFAPSLRPTVSGATVNATTMTAVQCQPKWSTVAGSTANLGTIRGLHAITPAVALFGSSAGTELMTAYYAVDVDNLGTFSGTAGVAALRSAITAGTNQWFLLNNGGASSQHGSGHIYFNDNFGTVYGGAGTLFDSWISWQSSTNKHRLYLVNAATSLYTSNPAADRILIETSGLATAGELNFNCYKFSMGAQTGAVGNQVGNFVAGARSTGVGGEWSDFLLTQGANLTVDHAMGGVFGWTVNAPSMTLGTGTVTTAGALNVGGNVNQGSVNRFGVRILSNPTGGSGINAALWVTAGRSQFDGIVTLPRNTDANRGAAGEAGRIIFNTDDGQLNIDDGTNWTLPDGSVT